MRLFSKSASPVGKLEVDIHSHFVPAIDDGSQSIEETIEMLRRLEKMGFRKAITTPHIISDLFPNSPAKIVGSFRSLKEELKKESLSIELEVAAEHYLDEFLMKSIEDDQFLTFGEKYFLFETSFMTKPAALEEFIFKIVSKGMKPVMAHPERYLYFHNSWDLVTEIWNRGTLFQINISSLGGYYSKPAKNLAEKMIDAEMIHFLGTDAHNMEHLEKCSQVMDSKYFKKALSLPLLNNTL